jgi:hypothetical protein
MVIIFKKDDSKNDLEHDKGTSKEQQESKKNLNTDTRFDQFRVNIIES